MSLSAATRVLVPVVAPRTALAVCLDRWSTASQQHARRNAMIASTALARRRAEREDVEEFLAGLPTRPGGEPRTPRARVAHA